MTTALSGHMPDRTPVSTRLDVRGLSKSFGDHLLWKDLGFSAHSGQMIALTGPSGSGKSTLLNCIGLLEKPDGGAIEVNGRDITRYHAHGARMFRKHTLGYLFQDYALIDNATIEENLNVALPHLPSRVRKTTISHALQRVGLADRQRELVYQLSGGEQQRVALARLIVKQPEVILADEPTGALDHDNADMVIHTLRDMAGNGGIVIIATHSDHVVESCDWSIQL
ncbi:lipoprotein ABC transporter ATP-binding protein [Bifidobacterium hapali]|uniref:Lipoprotein ABC transporter ATP-binding protein n=3 Tax=Bifidobacterium TaxID=1678 RepID=A0A261FPX4_9BIFI|nr:MULTISPECIES: ATP-binding cassette domain-containing protein [Bifidobacterium]MBT1163361.1 ATP-binding cassette domain-containing protein [Bifidobacterium felsineum]OZG60866.1 lipoprotein ABC transporter ATP-binding protein [Bifidobacterium myosotis]OZG65335.1 lipoprotein ABC transporter ATP-binding protein [Bifidobacterium hapali]